MKTDPFHIAHLQADPEFFVRPDAPATTGSGAFRAAEAPQEVFGAGTRLETTYVHGLPPVQKADAMPANEGMLDGLVILLFFIYLGQLFRYSSPIALLFRSLTIPGQFDNLIGEQSVSFRSFLRNTRLTGLLTVLCAALKGCLIWYRNAPAVALPEPLMPWILPVLLASLSGILLYKRLITGIIAALSGKNERIGQIRTFNRLFFIAATLVSAPFVLLTSTADPESHGKLFLILLIILIVLILYYIGKSFSFFVSRKISILQWILYLCAVEIWPISFFVLFAHRGFEW